MIRIQLSKALFITCLVFGAGSLPTEKGVSDLPQEGIIRPVRA